MKDYSELSKWLQDDITKPAVIRNGDYVDTVIRVPYDDDFDFIFHQNSYNGEPMTVNANMAYCGIYNKLDGQLYDVKFPLKGKLDDTTMLIIYAARLLRMQSTITASTISGATMLILS